MHKLIRLWLDTFTFYGGGKGGSAPPAPDYRGAAVEQGAASRDLATAQTFANRPTLNTPFGKLDWSTGAGTDPSTGLPITQWSGNLSLSPEQQQALNAQQNIQAGRSGAAQQLLGQATQGFKTPFDWGGLPEAPGDLGSAQQNAYEQMSQMLEPGRSQQRAGLETQLANMGLSRGTEPWNRETTKLQSDFGAQDRARMGQALAEGRADVGTQQQLRQAGIAEQAQKRGMTLNELNALLTGQQVSMPQMPGFTSAQGGTAPNLTGAAQATGQYGINAAELGQQGGMDWGSLAGTVAGTALGVW